MIFGFIGQQIRYNITMQINGSILVTGSTQKDRNQSILDLLSENLEVKSLNHSDILTLEVPEDRTTIGIAEVRKGLTFISEKPVLLKKRVLLVLRAHKLTADAQNALLKVLEEPPANGLVVLSTQNENDLLPTVVSRCRKLVVKNSARPQTQSGDDETLTKLDLLKVQNLSLAEQLELAESLSKLEKDEIISCLKQAIEDLKRTTDQPSADQNPETFKLLKKSLDFLIWIQNSGPGVNLRLALEAFFVSE